METDVNVNVNMKKIVEAEDEERDRGLSPTGHVEQDQKLTSRNLTGELARRPKVEEIKVKGSYFQDSARPPYSRRPASVQRKGTDHLRKSKANVMKERSSWSSRLKDDKA